MSPQMLYAKFGLDHAPGPKFMYRTDKQTHTQTDFYDFYHIDLDSYRIFQSDNITTAAASANPMFSSPPCQKEECKEQSELVNRLLKERDTLRKKNKSLEKDLSREKDFRVKTVLELKSVLPLTFII